MPGVSRYLQFNMIETVGHGYIVIPRLVDRDDYVRTALRRQRVTILPDQGSSYIFDCYVSKEVMRNIIFPPDNESLGSAVVFITPKIPNKPFVIGTMTKEDETDLTEEGSFLLEKSFNNTTVCIKGNAETGVLGISVINNTGDANCFINLSGSENSSFRVRCKTKATIECDREINLTTRGTINLRSNLANNASTASSITVDNNNVRIQPNETFRVGEGDVPVPKGDELVAQLEATNEYIETLVSALQTALSTIDGTAGSVSSGPFNAAIQAASLGSYDDVNSDVAFIE